MGVNAGPQDAIRTDTAGNRARQALVARGVRATASGRVVSNVTGLVRQLVFAWIYGAGRQMDAFVMASVVILSIFASVDAALSATLIPVYTKIRAESEDEARTFLAAVSSLVAAGTALAGVLVYCFGPILIHWFAPGFGTSEAHLAVTILRVMTPALVFMGLSSISAGFLQIHGRFGSSAVMSIPRNLLLIVGAALLGRHFGIGLLAWGTLAGTILQLAIVLWPALSLGMPRRLLWQPRHTGIRTMFRRLPSVFADFFIYQAALIVDRVLASGLPGGMISSLNYAQAVFRSPLGIVGSLAVSIFPAFSEMAAEKQGAELARAVALALRLTTFIAVPLSLFLIFFRLLLIAVLYLHGSFGPAALSWTADALGFFSVGLVSLAWNSILSRTMLALGETRVLMVSAVCAVSITIVADLILIHPLRQGGLALGTSLGSWISTLVMLLVVRRSLKGFRVTRLFCQLLGSSLSAAIAYGGASLMVTWWSPPLATQGFGLRLVALLAGVTLGSALYFGLYATVPEGRTWLRQLSSLGTQVFGKSAG